MTIRPQSAVLSLPHMTWRGLVAPPYDIANLQGGHVQAAREFYKIDGEGHANTGRKPITFDFKLYFLNDLESNLFPDRFNEWFDAFAIDGTPGTLSHPLIGEIDSVPVDWGVEVSPSHESGVIMTLKFSDTVIDPEDLEDISSIVLSLTETAVAVDGDMAVAAIEWPTGQRVDSALDLARQLASLAFSARLTLEGMVNQAKGLLGGIIDSVNSVADHANWALEANLKSMWVAVDAIGESAGIKGTREIGKKRTTVDTSVDEFASENKNTIGEIYTLNFSLVGQPAIPKGTTVRYFAS